MRLVTLAILTFITSNPVSAAQTLLPDSEIAALRSLYDAANQNADGRGWEKYSTWESSTIGIHTSTPDPCAYYTINFESVVRCNDAGTHVIQFDLNGYHTRANGTISSDINQLTQLTFLRYTNMQGHLSGATITGPFPNIDQLTQLRQIDLSWTDISTMPKITHCTHLQKLSLLGCHYIAETFPDISALSQLQSLDLSWTRVTGSLPIWSHHPLLESVDMRYGPQLVGRMNQHSLDKNTKLYRLLLAGNNYITGQLPSILPNELHEFSIPSCTIMSSTHMNLDSNMVDFSIYNCPLTPTLPTQLPPNLESLVLSNCSLSIQLRNVSIFESPRYLRYVDLSWNGMYGSIPDLTIVRHFSLFRLSHNRFTNTRLPLWSSSGEFDFSYNAISFNLTEAQFPNDPNQESLSINLSHNALYGTLPEQATTSIFSLDLSYNRITGHINHSFITNLQQLMMDGNQLSGEVPSCTQYMRMNSLSLAYNQLTSLSSSLFSPDCSSLSYLNLSHNAITSAFPVLDGCQNLGILDLSHNSIHGNIPNCANHDCSHHSFTANGAFMLQYNQLTSIDEIHNSTNWLASVGTLDISNNQIHGKLPNFNATNNHYTYHIDISCNNFNTTIPFPEWTRIETVRHICYDGVTGDCMRCYGQPIQSSSSSSSSSSSGSSTGTSIASSSVAFSSSSYTNTTSSHDETNRYLSITWIIIYSVAACVIAVVFVVVACYCRKRAGRSRSTADRQHINVNEPLLS